MRTHVEFRSNLFPAYPGEEEEINPDCWGKRLAEYLQTKLPGQGIPVEDVGDPFVEDWGVGFHLQHSPFRMWIGCANYEFEDNRPGHLVFIEPSKPVVRKGLFQKVDTRQDVERVAAALDRILHEEPGIRDVRWWDETER